MTEMQGLLLFITIFLYVQGLLWILGRILKEKSAMTTNVVLKDEIFVAKGQSMIGD